MNRILEGIDSIFIPDITTDSSGSDMDKAYFMREIYSADDRMKNKNYRSEITVPLFYMMMPFGCIQVNHASPLTGDDLQKLRDLAESYSLSLSDDKQLFDPLTDIILTSDLSINGLGITFREESFLQHFDQGGLVIFTVYLPENRQVKMLGRVVSITLNNNWYRIGCVIIKTDPQGEAFYKDFYSQL